ncbi:hypothetical protein DXG01_006259 [Tephrocybe rancida]|nr:hypothetical protein DXG01_006259 [Tephrocybe rancida]
MYAVLMNSNPSSVLRIFVSFVTGTYFRCIGLIRNIRSPVLHMYCLLTLHRYNHLDGTQARSFMPELSSIATMETLPADAKG